MGYPENRELVAGLRPESASDWLLVAGDVGEFLADIEWALRVLSERFATVVWVPGNHDLWTHRREPVPLRGEHRYQRLAELDPELPTILVNHFPLVREPTLVLRYPVFSQWCGTTRTARWHVRFNAAAVVYGHLHIPRTAWYDGVRFEEVSLGYPREWRRRGRPPLRPRQIFPAGPVPA